MSEATNRAWFGRLGLALLIGLAIGGLAYLSARGVTGVMLLADQRELLSSFSSFSLDGPPSTDLRAARKQLDAIAEQYHRLSILTGLLIGTMGAIGAYLRFEQFRTEATHSVA
ncbi:MAG: hypothetical protein OHK0050_44100 [Roseiflexaceae bacterium]